MSDDELNDGKITYYYSREERLKKAPKSVRDYYNSPKPRKRGFFGIFTSTKPLTFLFLSVVTLCVAVIMLSNFLNKEGVRSLGNNTVSVSAIGAGENSYVTVKKTNPGDAYSGAVDVAVSLPGEGNPIYTERIYFGVEEEELFRLRIPFRGKKLVIVMEAGTEQVHYTVSSGQ